MITRPVPITKTNRQDVQFVMHRSISIWGNNKRCSCPNPPGDQLELGVIATNLCAEAGMWKRSNAELCCTPEKPSFIHLHSFPLEGLVQCRVVNCVVVDELRWLKLTRTAGQFLKPAASFQMLI